MKPRLAFRLVANLFICLLAVSSYAQKSPHPGSFSKLVIEVPVAERWSLYSDTEIRSVLLYDRFYHAAVRLGISHRLTQRIALTFAGGYYENFNGGPEYDNYRKYDEFRLWQQGAYRSKLWISELENRIRLEEVLAHKIPVTLRYRLQAKVPVNRSELSDKTLYLFLNDEVFFSLSQGKINRNRLSGGVGYRFNQRIAMQTGLIQQTDYKPVSNISKNFLIVQLTAKL